VSRRGILAVLLVIAVQPCAVCAQTRVPTIGLLWLDVVKPSPFIAPLVQGLRDFGYVPGRNIRIDDRFLVKTYDELPGAAGRLVAEKPDIIVTYGSTAAQTLLKTGTTIPVVMASIGDPVVLGLVKSFARPGTNYTGITILNADLSAKRLELLKEAFPRMRRVAVALYPQSQSEVLALRNLEAAAREMGLETRTVEIRMASEIVPAIAAVNKLEVSAIAFIGSSLFRAHAAEIAAAVAKTRLPAIYNDEHYTESGGLLSYGPAIADNFRHAAVYIDKILKGAKPADLPVEQPTRMRLIVNAKTAKAQGIEIPRVILLRADKVIE
jgi:putative ABC transport system substrate-binding protein